MPVAVAGPTSESAEGIVNTRLKELKQKELKQGGLTELKEGENHEYYKLSGDRTPYPEEAAYDLKVTLGPVSGDQHKIREINFVIEWKPERQVNYTQRFRLKSFLEVPNP